MRNSAMIANSIALFLLTGTTSLAQDNGPSAGEVEAYRKGYAEGWNDCQSSPTCGVGTTGVEQGTAATYEFPISIFPGVGPGTTGIEVPSDWYVAPSASGQGIYGKVDPDGQFQPFVLKPDGQIDLLPKSQAPVWTANPAVKGIFSSLPKASDGFVFVPVQPSAQR